MSEEYQAYIRPKRHESKRDKNEVKKKQITKKLQKHKIKKNIETENNKKKCEGVEGRGASDAVPPSRDGTGCHPTIDNYLSCRDAKSTAFAILSSLTLN